MYWRKELFSIVLVGLLLFVMVIFQPPLSDTPAIDTARNLDPYSEFSLYPSDLIRIDNNSHFDMLAVSEGWDTYGDGTSADSPYVIEGYHLSPEWIEDAIAAFPGICINDTTRHFILF